MVPDVDRINANTDHSSGARPRAHGYTGSGQGDSGHGNEHGAPGAANNESYSYCPTDPRYIYQVDENMQQYWCKRKKKVDNEVVEGEYNEGKSLSDIFSIHFTLNFMDFCAVFKGHLMESVCLLWQHNDRLIFHTCMSL